MTQTEAVAPACASVTFVGDDRALGCHTDQTLLHAGLRSGVQLSYECASGGCGSCRAQLVSGEVRSLWPDAAGLSERDRRRSNRILMCQSVPLGDVVVKAPLSEADGASEPEPGRHTGRLIDRVALTADTALFRIEFDHPIHYLPGQFVLVESPSGIRRAYSMARPAGTSGETCMEFVIRAKPGGAGSNWLFNELRVGDAVRVEGPYGRAYARPDGGRPVLCVAGGTGLAPVLAICDHIIAEQRDVPVHLYIGARTTADLVLRDRISELASRGAQVSYSVQETSKPDAGVRTGTVIEHVAADWPDLSDSDIYLAGPAGMVDAAMRAFVREAGARADRLYFDRFIA